MPNFWRSAVCNILQSKKLIIDHKILENDFHILIYLKLRPPWKFCIKKTETPENEDSL